MARRSRILKLYTLVQIYCIVLTISCLVYIKFRLDAAEDPPPGDRHGLRHSRTSHLQTKRVSAAPTTAPTTEHGDWTHVGNQVYVYSAYWDNRSDLIMGNTVKVLGITPTSTVNNGSLSCEFYFRRSGDSYRVTADVEFIRSDGNFEDDDKPMRPAFIGCAVEPLSGEPPYAVSIQQQIDGGRQAVGPPNPVMVRTLPDNPLKDIKDKMAVCVRAAEDIIQDTLMIAQFIAYYIAVGVSKFIFFNSGMTDEVWSYIQQLRKQLGLDIEIRPWNLYKYSDDLYDNARIISINDCMYKYMYRYEYIAVVDFDEFLAPMRPDISLQHLLNFTERVRNSWTASAFLFTNKFYCLEYQPTTKPEIPLTTQMYTRMYDKKRLRGYHSRYILRPHLTQSIGNINIWKMMPKTQLLTVKSSIAYLHHYTKCRGVLGKDWKASSKNVKDASFMTKFRDVLLNSKVIKLWIDSRNRTESEIKTGVE